jgi:calpain-7
MFYLGFRSQSPLNYLFGTSVSFLIFLTLNESMAPDHTQLIQLKAPRSDESKYSTREKIILLRSSKLHGCVFPPWQEPPSAEEFQGTWQDSTDFRLSQEQLDAFDCWKSPDENLDQLKLQSSRVDLVQDITTDCSVVASLCALTARSEKLGSGYEHILAPMLFPSNKRSENGKYILKLHFNGCFRKVMIDDRLPRSKAIRSLHCFDRNDATNFIPALIEKAYLKVRGGYDFPGSNSGTDLWILTGWIPEQLFLQRFVTLWFPVVSLLR